LHWGWVGNRNESTWIVKSRRWWRRRIYMKQARYESGRKPGAGRLW
jgi:hypothetical protein